VLKIVSSKKELTSNKSALKGYSGYLYGFNGMEKDDEIKGAGNSYDYKNRFFDSRLGRFLSIDRLNSEFPSLSTYQFASNQVIVAIDLDGKEPLYLIDKNGKLTEPVIELLNVAFGFDKTWLRETTWTDLQTFTLEAQGSFGLSRKSVKTYTARIAIEDNGAHATTLGHDVIYDSKLLDTRKISPPKWLGLIAHESSHGEDYREKGTNTFLIEYIIAGITTKYEDIETEQDAYSVGYRTGSIMDAYLAKQGAQIMNILKDPNMTDDAKKAAIKPYAIHIRLIYIEHQIRELEKQAKMWTDAANDPNYSMTEVAKTIANKLNEKIKKFRDAKQKFEESLSGGSEETTEGSSEETPATGGG